MPGYPSKLGFGHQPFGSEPFGSSDWAEEVLWKIIPQFYRTADLNAPGLVPQPLRGFIDSIKPLFQEIRLNWQQFPTLWDANECPFPQLPALAYNVGINITSIETVQLIDVLPAPFTLGEQIVGSVSGTTGFISPPLSGPLTNILTIVGVAGSGFKVGETITGNTSGQSATILSIAASGTSQLLTISTFLVGETISLPPQVELITTPNGQTLAGSATSPSGTIGSISGNTISVNAVSGVGFANGDVLTGGTSNATGVVNGITIDGKSEAFLRSQVLNASQLWINKGTDKGYSIVAAFEGLLVDITPLWAETCAPDPNGELLTVSPPNPGSYLGYYDDEIADHLTTDDFFDNPFDAWPLNVDSVNIFPNFPEGRCRSYSLNLFFYTPDNTEIENFDSVSQRILTNLTNFQPIHVKFNSITFDGPRASSQSWYQEQVIADSYAAGDWNTQIIGALEVSSQDWILYNFNTSTSG
jgi:hypothetical protein